MFTTNRDYVLMPVDCASFKLFFIKTISQGLPSSFCKNHLPKKDETIVLENEKGEEWDCVYLGNKSGLSGGWRGFSLDHGLVDGDALVFELIEPCRFKVNRVSR